VGKECKEHKNLFQTLSTREEHKQQKEQKVKKKYTPLTSKEGKVA